MLSTRSRLTALSLVVAMTLLAVPGVQLQTAPTYADVERTIALGERATGYVGTIDDEGLASVAARLDGRDLELRWVENGSWSDWHHFHPPGEHAPDLDSPEALTADAEVSEAVMVGSPDLVEVRADAPGDVELQLIVESGTSLLPQMGSPGHANEAPGADKGPRIISREEWDPRSECVPRSAPDVAVRVRRVFVHHTAIFDDYTSEQAGDYMRAMCLSHVEQRGFDDLAYNFVIDKYGRIFEGRAGGTTRAVVGAHAQGFNHGSVGIALLGNFEDHGVPAPALDALDRLTAWLMDLHRIDPVAVTTHVSSGGPKTHVPEGRAVQMPSIVGHRDINRTTACPGDELYALIEQRRSMRDVVRHRLVEDYGWDVTGSAHTTHPDPLSDDPAVDLQLAPGQIRPAPVPGVPPEPRSSAVEVPVQVGKAAGVGPVMEVVANGIRRLSKR